MDKIIIKGLDCGLESEIAIIIDNLTSVELKHLKDDSLKST